MLDRQQLATHRATTVNGTHLRKLLQEVMGEVNGLTRVEPLTAKVTPSHRYEFQPLIRLHKFGVISRCNLAR